MPMCRMAGRRVGAALSLSLLVSMGAATGLSSSAASVHPATAGVGALAEAEVQPVLAPKARPRVDLPRPARGQTAIRLLGDQLHEAAALNAVTEAGLVQLLGDPAVWLDRDGWVFFKDEVAVAPAVDPVSAEAPLDQTFLLHSKPGSQHTIFLDFDGGAASATGWHQDRPAVPTTQPAWDPSGNGPAFDDAERTKIQTVWQAVAEDYAPFDIDVTTADPGGSAIHRASVADPTFGSHVLITPSDPAHDAICGGCGGVAYLNAFHSVHGAGGDGYGFLQPAWVFPQQLGDSAKNIAEAVSHEVGHNLGLNHDGNASQGYDTGHGAWGPIMGVAYGRAISQWSKGDYSGANNLEDDVAMIRTVAGERADEAGSGIAGAPVLPTGTAFVTTRTDVDTYLLGLCSGTVTVNATAHAGLANLDLALSILDAAGQVVASADPPSGQANMSVVLGMSASLTQTLDSGTYYASVDGVGNMPWSTGYDDYGSLGAYTVDATGCVDIPPVTTTTLTSTASGRSVGLVASVSAASGTPLGTVQFRDGATDVGTVTLGAGTASLQVDDLLRGKHHFTAEFVPTDAASYASSRSIESAVEISATPTAASLTASVNGRSVTLGTAVSPPVAGTVQVREGATVVGTVALAAGDGQLTLSDVPAGAHTYTASFIPVDDLRHAPSTSPDRTVTVLATPTAIAPTSTTPVPTPQPPDTVASSTTKVVAARKARVGSRPVISVTVVRGTAPAAGKVVVTVGNKRTALTLSAGAARLKLPKVRTGKLKITVRYLGDATTAASSAAWTIRVKPGRR